VRTGHTPLSLSGRGAGGVGSYPDPTAPLTHLQNLFLAQCAAAQLEILPGPGKIARWSIPASARDEKTGDLLHTMTFKSPPPSAPSLTA